MPIALGEEFMSYSIRYRAAFPALFGTILSVTLITGCGGKGEDQGAGLPGKAVYSELNCPLCHGEYDEDTERAPKLRDLERNFSREQLVEYLSNPDAYITKDTRLTAQKSSYSAGMPAFQYLGSERLQQLAEYLLVLK